MMKNLLAAIRGQTEATTPAEALRVVDDARAGLRAAQERVTAAREAYTASLLQDDEKATLAARREVERWEVLVDRADAAITFAENRLAEAEARAAEAERRQRYAEAEAKIEAAKKALAGYTAHALAIRGIMKAVAEANLAMSAVNADLPDGEGPLLPAECQVRGVRPIPERVLSRERLPDTWFYAGEFAMWGELPPGYHGEVRQTGPHTGVFQKREPEFGRLQEFPVERRTGGIKTYYMPEHPGAQPEALHTQVMLPGFHSLDPVIWSPTGELKYLAGIGNDGRGVLEAVAAREAAPKRTREEVCVEGASRERVEWPPVPAAADQPAAA